MLLSATYYQDLSANGSNAELVTEDAIDMSKTTIQFATMREMLALAGDMVAGEKA